MRKIINGIDVFVTDNRSQYWQKRTELFKKQQLYIAQTYHIWLPISFN